MDRGSLVLAACVLAARGAHATHPLISEDTGTQGRGRWQLELNGERTRDRVDDATVQGKQAAAVLSYGFAENADLQAGLPYREDGTERGFGDASIDVKWRFYESGPLSLGLKPGVTLPTGRDERGPTNATPGRCTRTPAIATTATRSASGPTCCTGPRRSS